MRQLISTVSNIIMSNSYAKIYSGCTLFTSASITYKMEKTVFTDMQAQGVSIPNAIALNIMYTPVIIGYSIIKGIVWPLLLLK